MSSRDRLIELLQDWLPRVGDKPRVDNPLIWVTDEVVGRIADHLIDNGVVLQEVEHE